MAISYRATLMLFVVLQALVDETILLYIDLMMMNGTCSNENIEYLVNALSERRQSDVLDVLLQTVSGSYELLERSYHEICCHLRQFYIEHHPDANRHPHYCFRFTNRSRPVRQESMQRQNGTSIATAANAQTRSGYQVSTSSGNQTRQPTETGDCVTSIPGPSGVPFSAQRVPQEPGEPREPVSLKFVSHVHQRQTLQDSGNHSQPRQIPPKFWDRLINNLKRLEVAQFNLFVAQMNRRQEGLFASIELSDFPDDIIINAYIIRPLKAFVSNGMHDVVSLLNEVFRDIGREDLAPELRLS